MGAANSLCVTASRSLETDGESKGVATCGSIAEAGAPSGLSLDGPARPRYRAARESSHDEIHAVAAMVLIVMQLPTPWGGDKRVSRKSLQMKRKLMWKPSPCPQLTRKSTSRRMTLVIQIRQKRSSRVNRGRLSPLMRDRGWTYARARAGLEECPESSSKPGEPRSWYAVRNRKIDDGVSEIGSIRIGGKLAMKDELAMAPAPKRVFRARWEMTHRSKEPWLARVLKPSKDSSGRTG